MLVDITCCIDPCYRCVSIAINKELCVSIKNIFINICKIR